MIGVAYKTLAYDWRRFVPAIMAVGFAGLLLAVQAALVLGIFGSAAVYVKTSSADLWAGHPGTQSVNFGSAIGPDIATRLRIDPDVKQVEPYLWVDGEWRSSPHGGGVAVYVSGIETRPDGLLFDRLLTPAQRRLLDEPGAVIVDRAEIGQLDPGPNGSASINGQRVHIVATVSGLRGLGGINVVASQYTARWLRGDADEQDSTYFLARLRQGADRQAVRDRVSNDSSFGPYAVWTAQDFAWQSQRYWLLDTGAGVAVMFMAAVVLIVGAVTTSQSLIGMVAGSAREYAMLNALGVSRRSLGRIVLAQSLWVGGLGLVIATLGSLALLRLATVYDVPVAMTIPMALTCMALVATVALLSGIIALRGLLRADPALLLR
jgi:putative ABC transport system permease protein